MELVRFPSRGGFSVRSIFTFALTAIFAALLWTILSVTPTHAATDATWGGDSIVYNQHGFTKAEAGSFKDTSNTIPDGATVYKTPVQTVGTGADASEKVFIIYFSSGVDPPVATEAQYVEFDYKNGTLSNPHNAKEITLTVKAEQGYLSSCSVDGIGWIICPVSVFLADAMDKIFDILTVMIETQPLVLGDTSSSLYVAWNIMRTVANIAFVIVFLIIIYSQLTSLGVTNYGLKKMVPRLVVAAILVNLSFYISALAIDISNILGYSIQDVFKSISDSTFTMTNDNVSGFSENQWSKVTTLVLGGVGGTIAGVYYMANGGLYLLLPLLLGLILTILMVVIILAARQAIIIIMVIVAPLAFVANLLPNTEKWFDKWKDLFFTMLIFFPAFSFVFGASQLAGQIIIQNANDIVMLLFGLAVQIAPLAITPLLLRLSGNLLGKITQIANNPKKGMLDKSRATAEKRAELARQRNIAQGARLKNPASWGAGMVRRSDFKKRNLTDKGELWKQKATNRYNESKGYEKIHDGMHEAHIDKEAIEERHKAHLAHKVNTRGSNLNLKTINLEDAKVDAEKAAAETSHMISAYRAGVYDVMSDKKLGELQKKIARNVIETSAWKQGEQQHQYAAQRNIANAMRGNADGKILYDDTNHLLDIAQGHGTIELKSIGRDNAQASAVATLTKLSRDARENAITLIQTQAVEGGKAIPAHINDLFEKANKPNTTVTQTQLEAALEIAADEGMVWLFEKARGSETMDQGVIDSVVARHVTDLKAKGGFHIQQSPDLSLQRYLALLDSGDTSKGTSKAEVEKTFERDLAVARLSTLSNTTADRLGGVKFGVFAGLSGEIDNLLELTKEDIDLTEAKIKNERDSDKRHELKESLKRKKAMLVQLYDTLNQGLSDSSTRSTLTDRIKMAEKIENSVGKFIDDNHIDDSKKSN